MRCWRPERSPRSRAAQDSSIPTLRDLPIAKVQGLRELAAVCEGSLDGERARPMIAAQTRQYAKRQRTWFRHQLPELRPVETVSEVDQASAAVSAWLATR